MSVVLSLYTIVSPNNFASVLLISGVCFTQLSPSQYSHWTLSQRSIYAGRRGGLIIEGSNECLFALSMIFFYSTHHLSPPTALVGKPRGDGNYTILNGGQVLVGRDQPIQQLSGADTITSTTQCDR